MFSTRMLISRGTKIWCANICQICPRPLFDNSLTRACTSNAPLLQMIKQLSSILSKKDLSFFYGIIFLDNRKQSSGADSRNVCVFAEAQVDRSPTGSGVSGRMAIHHARSEVNVESQPKTIESITGSVFHGSIVREETYGPHAAIISQVEGTAFITGQHTFVIDPRDPMRVGFILR